MNPPIKRPKATPRVGARPAAFASQNATPALARDNNDSGIENITNQAIAQLGQHVREGHYEDMLGTHLLQNNFVAEEVHKMILNKIVALRPTTGGLLQRNFLMELFRAGEGDLNAILDFLVRTSGLPFIQLTNFYAIPQNPEKLKPELCENLGTVILSESEKLVEIVITNPLDDKLQELLSQAFQPAKVSFFISGPDEIDHYYKQLRFNNHAAESSLFSRR